MSERIGSVERRTVLGGLGTGLAGLAVSGVSGAERMLGAQRPEGLETDHADSHHPGHPRFLQVGESLFNPPHVGEHGAMGIRDNLAPRIPDPTADPENYPADAFEWSILDQPADSEADLTFGTSTNSDWPRWESGDESVAEFEPDAPGRYVFELSAPDGTHEWTMHVFPDGSGPHPTLSLDGSFDEGAGEFVIEADASVAPDSDTTAGDLETVFLADDRDELDTEAIEYDGLSARVPIDALGGESVRVHAAAFDGEARSMVDTVELTPDGSVSLPNRPPEWAEEGIMYQIFPRSWAGEPGETTMDDLVEGVEYLDELGIDMVWLTPVVPDEATARQFDQDLLAEAYRSELGGVLSGGGPHGYATLDYFGISPDLVPDGKDPIEAYREFVDACHEAGIRVVFDQVISHCGRSHPFFQDTIDAQGTEPPHPVLEYPAVEAWNMDSKYFDWFARVDRADVFEGEDVEPNPLNTGFFGLRLMPNFNYNNVAVREHMLAMADFWSGVVGVDGFRCDIAWGVPNSLWKEVREVVRDNDSEFLMLDETIPKDPRMAENAFDMHFDTEGFTVHSHSVANGETDPGQLVDDVRQRRNEGIPPHSLVLNLVENHDEQRLLNQTVVDMFDPNHDEISDEEWEDGAHLQRMCWATGVALPGVPGIYYGQERQISRFGEGRHRGDGDHRGQNGGIDVAADVRPGGRQRAFMNWDEYPEEHLQFYTDVVDLYHDLDVLKPAADIRNVWTFTSDNVLAFGRDASHLDEIDGPERVVVLANFETGPSTVTLRPSVGTTDLLTGEEFADVNEFQPGTTIELDGFVVLEASDLYDVGSGIADFEPPSGTDYGPGEYVYPTGETFEDDIFAIEGFEITETADQYQFRVDLGGDLTNPADLEHGLTHQHVQVYIRDPSADEGATEARTGVNATFEDEYQYRVVTDGANGTRLESHDGTELATGEFLTNTVANEFLITVDKTDLGIDLSEAAIAPLMLGFDDSAPGNVRQVTGEATDDTFGGADGDTAPNVIDTGFPGTFPNESVLEYGDERATIPYAGIVTEFEAVETFDVETGSGYGPGTYEVPTGDDYYEEAWDIDELTIEESRDNVRFEYTMATEPENPWQFDTGFSHPHFQIYIHVPDGSAASTQGRDGTNIAFQEPYHYRVVVHGEGVEQVENAEGDTVTRDVDVTTEGRTITLEFSKAAVDWETAEAGVAVAPTIMSFDGFGEGDLRAIAEEPDEHTIGGGHAGEFDPAVMDMVVPAAVERETVLADYGEDDPPELPFVGLGPMEDIVGDADEAAPDEEESDEDADESDDEDDGMDYLPIVGVGGAVAGAGGAGYLLKKRMDGEEAETTDES